MNGAKPYAETRVKSAETEQDVRPEAGQLVADLPLETDRAAQQRRHQEAQRHLPVRDRQFGHASLPGPIVSMLVTYSPSLRGSRFWACP